MLSYYLYCLTNNQSTPFIVILYEERQEHIKNVLSFKITTDWSCHHLSSIWAITSLYTTRWVISSQYCLLLIAYLYQSSLVHSTEDKKGVRRPVHVGYLVQAGIELQDLQGAHISHHQPVLHTGSLRSTTNETSQKGNGF